MKTKNAEALAQNIKKARKKTGKTQSWLAEQLGISRNSVSRWEAGNALPSTEHLYTLSNILNTDFINPKEELIQNENLFDHTNFRKKLDSCNTISEIQKISESYFAQFLKCEFTYLHVFRGDLETRPSTLCISNADEAWRKIYRLKQFKQYDPMWQLALNTTTPVFSDVIETQARRNNDVKVIEIFETLRKYNYTMTCIIPIHGPSCIGLLGIAVLGEDQKQPLQQHLPNTTLASHYIYEAVQRIINDNFSNNTPPILKGHDRSIVYLLLHGQKLKAIADKIGISESAIKQRIQKLQNRFGVENRDQLNLMIVSRGLVPRNINEYKAIVDPFDIHKLHAKTDADPIDRFDYNSINNYQMVS